VTLREANTTGAIIGLVFIFAGTWAAFGLPLALIAAGILLYLDAQIPRRQEK